jgi:site-specific recombinase XerD
MSWDRKIGITPKVCRDTVATTLRDADVNERVLGSILGHTPKNSTGLYCSVSTEAKLKVLQNLS